MWLTKFVAELPALPPLILYMTQAVVLQALAPKQLASIYALFVVELLVTQAVVILVLLDVVLHILWDIKLAPCLHPLSCSCYLSLIPPTVVCLCHCSCHEATSASESLASPCHTEPEALTQVSPPPRVIS